MNKSVISRIVQRIKKDAYPVQFGSFNRALAAKYNKVSSMHRTDKCTVIIYQMGKVGSSTVKDSIERLNLPINLYHVHALTHERLKWLQDTFKHASKIKGRAVIHDHVVEGLYLRKKLDESDQQDWKVITLIRDPISRNISTFFQSLDIFFPEWVKEHNASQRALLERTDEMIELFLNEANHDLPLIWFDSYLKPVFNIDVYDKKFNAEKGYETYTNGHTNLLLLRLENLDDCVADAFREFLDIEDFDLKKSNISSEKSYSDAYNEFKDSIKLPASYIDKMYSSKFVQHFYTKNEIEQLRNKWEH